MALAVLALPACHEPAPVQPAPLTGQVASAAQTAAPAPAGLRYLVGGDSRDDVGHVAPWAFREAKARGVGALIFLGDMEHRPDQDDHFRAELAELAPVPFVPVLGNHESAMRKHGADAPREARVAALQAFRGRFLGPASVAGGFAPRAPAPPVESAFDDKLTYSIDLPGGVHFIALDNVSQPGFGADQLAWLGKDLEQARASGKAAHVVVGLHKALVGSGVTRHAMEEDGPAAAADSAAALALFEKSHVELVFASHFHGYAEYAQKGIRTFITGGLGAPVDKTPGGAGSFHHVLVLGVPETGPLTVETVRFPGPTSFAKEEER